MNKALQNYECEGQLSIFQMGDKPQRFHESEWLKAQGFKNIYDEQPPEAGLYEFTDIEYPTKIKRFEVTENGGIMFGSSDFKARWWRPILQKEPEPKTEPTDDYIKEHPTCFYVFGHYLDREDGWHKVPDELPTFTEWTTIDVVLFGKKTGTPWMEHGKWEAKDWTFRSLDERRDTETIEVLAWCVSD